MKPNGQTVWTRQLGSSAFDIARDVDVDRRGLGVVAARADAVHLLGAMFRAARVLGSRRRRTTVQRRMMKVDWSWSGPAEEYLALYRSLVGDDAPVTSG